MPNYMKAMNGMGNPGLQKEAKMKALEEILSMLGDMEAEPFMPKGIKAVKVDVLTKKPMDGMGDEMDAEAMGEKPEEENGLDLEAEVKGESLEEIKRKLAMLLK